MPRKIIPIVTGEKYHVYNRGVDKRDIFLNKVDYVRFYMCLDLFNSVEPVHNFRLARAEHRETQQSRKLASIEAYALLPNHFHLIISPLVDGGIGELLRRVCAGYTSYFNEKNDRSGALFQGTFQRVHIETQEQYQYVFAYVNENHSVHKINTHREICHSSSLHYQGLAKSKLLSVITTQYSLEENVALANEIYLRRKGKKNSELLEN